jgi:hypothetical protein
MITENRRADDESCRFARIGDVNASRRRLVVLGPAWPAQFPRLSNPAKGTFGPLTSAPAHPYW